MAKARQILNIINILSLTLFMADGASGQFYNRGQDPAFLKWQQINTEHFRVIFPSGFKSEADRFTHYLESYYKANSDYLNHRPSRIPVVLHNHSIVSNGFVAWAPKRMEVVTTPDATSFSQDWLEQLALHEYRHVVQIDKLKQGFTRGLSWFLGEAGTGAMAGLLPFWYLEGDATDAETRLSLAGRGRLPSFEMGIKAILLEDPDLYPYEKAIFGSYRDYIPNHYEYGFQMVSHGRRKYGNSLWDNMVNNVARRPFTLYPNYFSLKKQTGLSKTGYYKEAFETLRSHWKVQAEKRELTEFDKVNRKETKHFTSYKFPRYLNDSVIFVEKSGIGQINEFVSIDRSGKERRIHRPGFNDGASINVGAGRIVWSEIIWDPRWERRSWSVIKIYDLDSGQERILKLKTRYFAPDISQDGNFIAAVEVDLENRYFLVILHAITGDVILRIESPENRFLQYPVLNDDNSGVYMTALDDAGKWIVYHDLNSGEWSTLFYAEFEDIAQLDYQKDYLVFRGSFSGIDNIYALNVINGEIGQVTFSRFGAHTPSLSSRADTLLYSDYNSMGFDLVKIPFSPENFSAFSDLSDPEEQLNLPSEEEEENVIRPGLPDKEYESKKYRKTGNLLNFHSWAPFYIDINDPSIEELPINPGLMLVSQNLLSTATAVLGYEYNLDRRDHFLHASFTYAGWYPVIELSVDYGGLPLVGAPSDSTQALETVRTDLSLGTRVEIPLNLTFNRYVMGARPSVEGSFSRAYLFYESDNRYRNGLTLMDYRLYYYSYLKKAYRDILPRFGGFVDLRYVNTPFEEEQIGSNSLFSGVLYLPGILPHQTLRIFAGRQKQDVKRYLMGNLMSLPRGYPNYSATELTKYTFDYVFPIAYPDWQVWRAAYFKRFRGSIFYDYAIGNEVYTGAHSEPVSGGFMSMGLELTTDIHIAQIFVPFNIGGRFMYLPYTGQRVGEFVFSMDLSGF